MEGSLHGIALILIIVASAYACYRFGRKPEAVAPAFVIGIVLGLFLAWVVLTIVLNSYSENEFINQVIKRDPITYMASHQWLIMAMCLGIIWYFIPLTHFRLVMIALVFILLGRLAYLHTERMVQMPHYSYAERTITWQYRERMRDPIVRTYWHSWLTGIEYQSLKNNQRQIAASIMLYQQESALKPTPAPVVQLPPVPHELGANWFKGFKLFPSAFGSARLHGNLNGAGMLALIAFSVIVLWRRRREIETPFQYKWRLLYAFALSLLAVMTLKPLWHYYPEAAGISHWLLPTGLLAIVGAWLPLSTKLHAKVLFTMILLSLLLMLQAGALKEGYFGRGIHNEDGLDRRPSTCKEMLFNSITNTFGKVKLSDTRYYSPGWFSDLPVWENHPDVSDIYRRFDCVTESALAWHTPLTGLYNATEHAVWYPGGPLKSGLKGLVYKRRI